MKKSALNNGRTRKRNAPNVQKREVHSRYEKTGFEAAAKQGTAAQRRIEM